MRILQVIHQFPPHSWQGAEVYCYQLSKRLLDRGDDVRVFHVSATGPRMSKRLAHESFHGLPTFHCIDGGEYARLAKWPNRFLSRCFDRVLDEFKPEIVHFHHFLSLGDQLVTRAADHGARVVYTLHDFGLICPNVKLLRTDGHLCGKNTPDFFQDCCPVLVRTLDGPAPWFASRVPSLNQWRTFAEQHGSRAIRATLQTGIGTVRWWSGDSAQSDVDQKGAFFLGETRRIIRQVDLFLAPSEFLRRRYLSCGIPPEKIVFARYGIQHFGRLPRRVTSGRLAFGYIGALHAHKGVELLLDAFQGMDERAELHVFGSTFGSPVSERYWQRISARPGSRVFVHGAYENKDISTILSGLDVVVVPSLWYENSPLTIQEAFIGGIPVITADQGGMAELVRDGVDGLHFAFGDAVSLRAKMKLVVEEAGLLERLRSNVPQVPEIEQQADDVRRRYEMLLH